jgi:regulatory protein
MCKAVACWSKSTAFLFIMCQKITALKAQKRNHQRINVYLDDEFAFGLSRFVAAWLHVGQYLSSEKICQLQIADAEEVAYQRALNFISYRPRSKAEVRKNLKKHATPEEVLPAVFERLCRAGLVDDVQFAQNLGREPLYFSTAWKSVL